MKPHVLFILLLQLRLALTQELDTTSPPLTTIELPGPAVVEGPPNHAVVEVDRTVGTPGRTQNGEGPGEGVGVDITTPIPGVDAPSVDESEVPAIGEEDGGESSTTTTTTRTASSALVASSSLPPSPPSSFLPTLSTISSSVTSIPSSNSSSIPSSSSPPAAPTDQQTSPTTTINRPILLPTLVSGDGPQSEQVVPLGGDGENTAPRLSMRVSVTVLVVAIVAGMGVGV